MIHASSSRSVSMVERTGMSKKPPHLEWVEELTRLSNLCSIPIIVTNHITTVPDVVHNTFRETIALGT